LPCSSVWAIVPTMKAGPTAVFPHEGTFTLPVHAHVRRTQPVERMAAGGRRSRVRSSWAAAIAHFFRSPTIRPERKEEP
jgi:hypothetical protein